jgi:hypothetical protein
MNKKSYDYFISYLINFIIFFICYLLAAWITSLLFSKTPPTTFREILKGKTREQRRAESDRRFKEYGIYAVIITFIVSVWNILQLKKDLIRFLLFLSLPLVALFLYLDIREGFGMSPGTPVQLSSTHVPTREDMYYWKNVYPKIVRREIYNLTESDLH